MNVSSVSHAAAMAAPLGQDAVPSDQSKIAKSCREFEGMVWRQVLEKSLQPLLTKADGGADKTGVYDYFFSNTMADAVSGGVHSFAAMLESQFTPPPSKNSKSS